MAEIDPRLQDHALGIELQIVDLVERRDRAYARQWPEEAAALQAEIDMLYEELAATAERLVEAATAAQAAPPVVRAPHPAAA